MGDTGAYLLGVIAFRSETFERMDRITKRRARFWLTGSDDDKPSITGGQSSYHVGDLVNVTCSYSRYGKPVDLQWHLNDKEVSDLLIARFEGLQF